MHGKCHNRFLKENHNLNNSVLLCIYFKEDCQTWVIGQQGSRTVIVHIHRVLFCELYFSWHLLFWFKNTSCSNWRSNHKQTFIKHCKQCVIFWMVRDIFTLNIPNLHHLQNSCKNEEFCWEPRILEKQDQQFVLIVCFF